MKNVRVTVDNTFLSRSAGVLPLHTVWNKKAKEEINSRISRELFAVVWKEKEVSARVMIA